MERRSAGRRDRLLNADGKTATAPVQIVSSFSTNDNSWLWAWDNPSIAEPLRADAETVRAYGENHGFVRLIRAKWTGTEEDAWATVAFATNLCDRTNAYRGPAGSSYVFMTFGEVRLSGRGTAGN